MEQLSKSASTLLALKNRFLIPGLGLMNYQSVCLLLLQIISFKYSWRVSMYGLESSDSCAFPDYSEDSTCYVTMWKRQLFADDTDITHCVKSERAAVDFPSGSCHILHSCTLSRPAVFDKKRLLLIGGGTPE